MRISFLLHAKGEYSKIVADYRVLLLWLTLSNILKGRQKVLTRFF